MGLITLCSYSIDFLGQELGSWVPLSYDQGDNKDFDDLSSC